MTAVLTQAQFGALSALVRRSAGIHLHAGKLGLVQCRLAGRLRELHTSDVQGYLAQLTEPGNEAEVARLVDALTTNKTGFFREPRHFELLSREFLLELRRRRGRLTLWSAGCSSGEEPYTLAMVLLERLGPTPNARILATDISARMIERARQGLYSDDALSDVPATLRPRHFSCVQARPPRTFSVNPPARQLVHFARLNLMAQWPMRGRFDLICCRNVMIYFDKPTQQQLVERFRQQLVPGGLLFTGHSESLAGLQHGFRYLQPAVYQRVDA